MKTKITTVYILSCLKASISFKPLFILVLGSSILLMELRQSVFAQEPIKSISPISDLSGDGPFLIQAVSSDDPTEIKRVEQEYKPLPIHEADISIDDDQGELYPAGKFFYSWRDLRSNIGYVLEEDHKKCLSDATNLSRHKNPVWVQTCDDTFEKYTKWLSKFPDFSDLNIPPILHRKEIIKTSNSPEAMKDNGIEMGSSSSPILVTSEMRKNLKSTPLTPEEWLEIYRQDPRSRDFHSFATTMFGNAGLELINIVEKQYLSCQTSVKGYYPTRYHAQMLPMCDMLRDRYLQKLSEVKAPFPEEVEPATQVPHVDPKQIELK